MPPSTGLCSSQISRVLTLVFVLAGVCGAATDPAATQATGGKVVQVVRDFEDDVTGDKRPAAMYWNWTAEQKAAALDFSSLEIIGAAPDGAGKKCLKLTVTDKLPPRRPGYRMIPLRIDYLPPDADALRMRVKVLKGRFTLAVGGPTVYFGHSDVLTRALQLDAATHAQWTTVELSLNQGLTRNDRRAQWGRHSPVIYYTRWIQEPLAIDVGEGSTGEMLIDQVELVAQGQGRPYPTFTPEQIRTVAAGPDFEDAVSMEHVFTVMSNTAEQPRFDQPPHLVRKTWPPPRLARVAEGKTGRHSLEMTMTGTEEVCFAGIKLAGAGAAEANAIALTIKAQHPGKNRPGVVLDFLAWATPGEARGAFPWNELRPPETWRRNPELAFTYYLCLKNPAAAKASFGFYHLRRLVPNDQWVTLVLPLADFICSYGQGALAPVFQKQAALQGDQLLALTFLSYFGQNAHPLRLLIDDVALVRVPGTPETLRSFHQSPLVEGQPR